MALYYLGLCHEVGAGTAINPELAIEYYQQASESNPSHAAALFGEAMAMLRARPGQEVRFCAIVAVPQPLMITHGSFVLAANSEWKETCD